MKVEGVLTIEGITFHIDIDADDWDTDIYVTNVHPNCLVIPKERWRVEFLGLPPAAVSLLHERHIFNLGSLVDGKWNLAISNLSKREEKLISEALAEFKKIALLFERVEHFREPLEKIRKDKGVADGIMRAQLQIVAPELGISLCGLSSYQELVLEAKGVKTMADLAKLGRNRLLMTRGLDQQALEKIELALKATGLQLSD